jgi:hypothetical protein
MNNSNQHTATAAWGLDIPDWVSALAQECDKQRSQRIVAEKLGYSAATVNLVLKNKYRGDIQKFSEITRGAFLKAVVECPEFGVIGLDQCHEYQTGKRFQHSSFGVQLRRACSECSNRKDL